MLLDRFDTVLFDLDGTLVDTTPHIFEASLATRDMFPAIARNDASEKERRDLALLKKDLELLPPAVAQEIYGFRNTVYARLVREGGQLMAGVPEMLDVLRGKLIGIVTASSRKNVEIVSTVLDVERFPVIVTRDDVKNNKPHPEGIDLALDHMNTLHDRAADAGRTMGQKFWRLFGAGRVMIPRERVLYIGNAIEDMHAATRAKVKRACVCPDPDEELLEETGRVFRSMHDLLAYMRQS